MKIIPLEKDSLSDWEKFLPEEIVAELMDTDGHMHAAGVTFLREPQGAIAWEEKGDEWILHSIYISPISRRLGLGSELVSYLTENMATKGVERLSVTYDPQEERVTLRPFLINLGFMVEPYELTLGVTTLKEAAEALQKYDGFQKSSNCKPLHQLSQSERELCNQWLLEKTGVSIKHYLGMIPESFVLMREHLVAGMMLMREQSEEISLDYCWASPDASGGFLSMAALAVASLKKLYPGNTRMEMILSTDQAEKLYSHLLGEKREYITICQGYFDSRLEEMTGV